MGKMFYGYLRCAVDIRDDIINQAHKEQRNIITVTNRILREGLDRIKAEQSRTDGDNLTLDN